MSVQWIQSWVGVSVGLPIEPIGASAARSSDATAFGWLVLVGLALIAASLLPLIAVLLRRRLPARRLDPEVFPFIVHPTRTLPVAPLGLSHKTRRSPRHAVAAHRTFLTATVLSAMGLVLLTLMPALPAIGESGLLVALAFALPALLVAWHGRRRDARVLDDSRAASVMAATDAAASNEEATQ